MRFWSLAVRSKKLFLEVKDLNSLWCQSFLKLPSSLFILLVHMIRLLEHLCVPITEGVQLFLRPSEPHSVFCHFFVAVHLILFMHYKMGAIPRLETQKNGIVGGFNSKSKGWQQDSDSKCEMNLINGRVHTSRMQPKLCQNFKSKQFTKLLKNCFVSLWHGSRCI